MIQYAFWSSWPDLSFELKLFFFRFFSFVVVEVVVNYFHYWFKVNVNNLKLKRRRKQKRKRGTCEGGAKRPPRRSLHPLRFCFRLRFNLRLIWINNESNWRRRLRPRVRFLKVLISCLDPAPYSCIDAITAFQGICFVLWRLKVIPSVISKMGFVFV